MPRLLPEPAYFASLPKLISSGAVILRDEHGGVVAIREHKDASEAERATREVNSGILVVDGAFLDRAVRALSTDNAQAELYLTDIVGQRRA